MSKPRRVMNSRNSSLSQTFLIAVSYCAAISAGRPFGAAKPRHTPLFHLWPVASSVVGTSGKFGARFGEKNTRLRTRPALISASASGIEHETKSTPPAARSVSAVAAPVDGTQRIELGETPSACISPASATCQLPPCPVPEAVSLFGFALIY